MTDFLWDSGGSNTGLVGSSFSLMTTEMNSLASAAGAVSSVGGTSGLFNQTNYSSAMLCGIYLTFGASFTPGTGSPDFLGWFLFNGTEVAVANTDLPRNPDFIIPVVGSNAYASSSVVLAAGIVRVPPWPHKVFLMNHTGSALPSSGSSLTAFPVAMKY
jgi:hypothetical protein